MKKTIMLMCMVAAALCFADATVLNPGFESMSAELTPDNWTLYKGNGATVYFAAKTDVVHSGTYSEKIAARQGYGMIYQEVTGAVAGESYSLTLFGRGDTNNDWQMDEPMDRIIVSVKFKNTAGGTISEPSMVIFDADPETAAPILSTSEWLQSPAMRFTVPEGTASFLIKINADDGSIDGNLGDGTSIYLDDITLAVEALPAKNPTPEDGAIEQSATALTLGWEPADDPRNAGSPNPDVTGYDLFIEQYNSVEAPATTDFAATSPINLSTAQYAAGALGTDQVVFWRVDTLLSGDPNVITGETWTFSTESSFPEIITQPQNVEVFKGEDATLSVDAIGMMSPIVLYEWYNSSDELVASGADMSSLNIASASTRDSGSYYCVIKNSAGKETQSESALLYVKGILESYAFENSLADSVNSFDAAAANIDPNAPAVIAYDTTGIDGSALLLDGENYLLLPEGAYPNSEMGLSRGSIVCWVKTISADNGAIIASYNDSHTTCINFTVQAGGGLYFYIRSEGNSVTTIQANSLGLNDGNWHQIAVTYSQGSNSAAYVDGELLATTTGIGASQVFAPWTYSLPIGAGDTRGVIDNVMDGSIDALTFYNYALSDKDILDLYNAFAAETKALCLDSYESAFDFAGPDGVGSEFADCRVDMLDFAAIAGAWLDCGLYPSCE
ncbi:MAG: LamG-like jellyroll fold domain-containing protein [Phycisphaerae bacterium]